MSKYAFALLSVALCCALFPAAAQQPMQQSVPKINPVPIQPTSPASGQQMYASYCAACHGATGVGNGPAAPAMKVPPTDLTLLARHNSGTFPTMHIISVLEFGAKVPAHGTADMPVWGDLMLSLHTSSAPDHNSGEILQRIANLTVYLKTLQK